MRCQNCGKENEDNANFCFNCGCKLNKVIFGKNDMTHNDYEILPEKENPVNPLLDKEYEFFGNDMAVRGLWGLRTNIKVGSDRLYIDMFPAKANKNPVVMLEDIMKIENKFYIRPGNIVIGIIGICLAMCGSMIGLIFPIIVVLLYRERKLLIYIRNGNIIKIYEDHKEKAKEFVEDIKRITKIE